MYVSARIFLVLLFPLLGHGNPPSPFQMPEPLVLGTLTRPGQTLDFTFHDVYNNFVVLPPDTKYRVFPRTTLKPLVLRKVRGNWVAVLPRSGDMVTLPTGTTVRISHDPILYLPPELVGVRFFSKDYQDAIEESCRKNYDAGAKEIKERGKTAETFFAYGPRCFDKNLWHKGNDFAMEKVREVLRGRRPAGRSRPGSLLAPVPIAAKPQ